MKKIIHIFIYVFALIGFILIIGYISLKIGWTKTDGMVDKQHDYFQDQELEWKKNEEWQVLREAILKDEILINKVATEIKISPRIIASLLIVEQMRLYNSEREIFKKIFAPLKILGNQNQFSLGVMGIKQETAEEIENNLKSITSPFYLGLDYENKLDFLTTDTNQERFERLIDEDDRYYSYLYAGIFIKQVLMQWEKSNYPIDDKIGIIATLYNIGFINSKPKPDPSVGGSVIEINNTIYSFGGLAESFYYSDELINNFARK